jgi:hypothetical protein
MAHPWLQALACIALTCAVPEKSAPDALTLPARDRCQVLGPVETLRRAIGVAHDARRRGAETTTLRVGEVSYVRAC